MYNAEKYIGACLTSLLAQTFQNFEVIVVDDCSTDSSYAIVESFIPKFGGRLRLSHMKKNSGGPALPTNKGIAFSVGKYVFSVDNDDLLTVNALETLYATAENFQADFIHMDRYLRFIVDTDKPFPKNENIILAGNKVNTPPTFESDDLAERIKKFCDGKIGEVEGWRNFVRRDLLIENEITMPRLSASQDMVWLLQLICTAKKMLHISDPLYIYRVRRNSITSARSSDEERTNFWLEVNIKSLIALEKFFAEQKFFRDNPSFRWQVLNYFEYRHFRQMTTGSFVKSPPHKFYELFGKELGDDFADYTDLFAYLGTATNSWRLRCSMMNQRVLELEQQLKNLQGGN